MCDFIRNLIVLTYFVDNGCSGIIQVPLRRELYVGIQDSTFHSLELLDIRQNWT